MLWSVHACELYSKIIAASKWPFSFMGLFYKGVKSWQDQMSEIGFINNFYSVWSVLYGQKYADHNTHMCRAQKTVATKLEAH